MVQNAVEACPLGKLNLLFRSSLASTSGEQQDVETSCPGASPFGAHSDK
jgi:hypothetical protein